MIKCSNNPCKNGARCVDQPSTFYGYNCVCVGSWTGVNCDQCNYKLKIKFLFCFLANNIIDYLKTKMTDNKETIRMVLVV